MNRSTYYKLINRLPSARELENRAIRSYILEIYANTDKRLGVHKIALCLKRDYRINISDGRVYRLIKNMNLPKMSAVKSPKLSVLILITAVYLPMGGELYSLIFDFFSFCCQLY